MNAQIAIGLLALVRPSSLTAIQWDILDTSATYAKMEEILRIRTHWNRCTTFNDQSFVVSTMIHSTNQLFMLYAMHAMNGSKMAMREKR